MPEEMNWKKFLTDNVLHEVWHEPKITAGRCGCSCGQNYYLPSSYNCQNRTFDNQDDMMEPYRYIYEDGKWIEFTDFVFKYYKDDPTAEIFDAWLFCLGDKNYESKCKMVAKFYGWEENK